MGYWTSVEERLPESGDVVMAFPVSIPRGRPRVARFHTSTDGRPYWVCPYSGADFAVDYWMPLPEPPET